MLEQWGRLVCHRAAIIFCLCHGNSRTETQSSTWRRRGLSPPPPRVQVFQLRHLRRAHCILIELCRAGSKASVIGNYRVAAEDVTPCTERGEAMGRSVIGETGECCWTARPFIFKISTPIKWLWRCTDAINTYWLTHEQYFWEYSKKENTGATDYSLKQ